MKSKLIIYGTGVVAEVASYYFQNDTNFDLVAYTNAQEFIAKPDFNNRPVVPFESIEKTNPPSDFKLFIALGYGKTNQIRQSRFLEAKRKGYECPTYISSRATYYGTEVGENCMILENNVIQPFVKIGSNVMLWSGNHVGHHSEIGDHCFVSSHVVISGSCKIGENCFLGVNATLRDNLVLGRYVVIGAGAVVMKDCEDRTLIRSPRSETSVIRHDVI